MPPSVSLPIPISITEPGTNNYQQGHLALSITIRSRNSFAVPAYALAKLPVNIQYLVTYGYGQENALRTYRNEYRKDEDYSVLFFLLFWGLNVVDATVDAHLMYFDVSDQLSMHLQHLPPASCRPAAVRPASAWSSIFTRPGSSP